jgi:hypothetical protein
MKKIRFSFVLMLLLGAAACKKNNGALPHGPTINGNVSSDDAAAMVAGAISVNSNGIADMATDAVLSAVDIHNRRLACGAAKSDTISRQSSVGSTFSYSYHSTYNFMVDCNGSNQADSLTSNLNYSGSFSNPYLSSTNSGTSVFNETGLLPTDTAYVINGQYKRSGSFNSKVDTANHGSNNIGIVINALTLKKSSQTIESGNATISITGDVPKKGSFSFSGTLVFNSDGTATLTLNGTVYTINYINGECNRRH